MRLWCHGAGLSGLSVREHRVWFCCAVFVHTFHRSQPVNRLFHNIYCVLSDPVLTIVVQVRQHLELVHLVRDGLYPQALLVASRPARPAGAARVVLLLCCLRCCCVVMRFTVVAPAVCLSVVFNVHG
jgi:hypothetical protein